ncbi:MAG TPA: MFS transporter, partial [Mycobacteriales bacterium]|nr:MFS transporter [Mycobacteriales bacterium]
NGRTEPIMPTLRPSSRPLARAAAFWLVGATVVALLAASSAPSPLYQVYQQEFGFSPIELTTIFAVYVLALLVTLLTVGRLSDFVGRRPVLAGALLIQALAMVSFLVADGSGWLLVARTVQGVATGAAVGVLGAYLLDLQPADGSRLGSLVNSVAPGIGLGIGALGTGLLVQYGAHPTRLVFVVLLATYAALILATAVQPETVRPVPGAVAALRPRIAVPGPARRAFAAAVPNMVATWALGGLVLSIGGSVVRSVFGQSNSAVVGLVLGIFAGAGAVTGIVVTSWPPRRIERYGTVTLVAGTAVFLTALAVSSLTLFVIASVVAGSGFGAGFLGALRSLTQLVRPHERAGLLSAVYVVSYLAFSIPALVAGLLITRIGLRDTSLYYGGFVLVAATASLVIGLLAARAARAAAAPAEPCTPLALQSQR